MKNKPKGRGLENPIPFLNSHCLIRLQANLFRRWDLCSLEERQQTMWLLEHHHSFRNEFDNKRNKFTNFNINKEIFMASYTPFTVFLVDLVSEKCQIILDCRKIEDKRILKAWWADE